MAPRWNLVLSSVLLAGHAIAEEEYEVFPLSGGIDNGVTATIDITGFDFSSAKIEFLKPSRDVAFGLTFKENQIERSWALGGDNAGSLTYGGWPTELSNGKASLEFTKRSKKWAISIEGKRFPWFDFVHQHGSTDLLTHVRVYSGMKDAEVTLERKACSTRCHADECGNYNESIPQYVVTSTGDCIDSQETTPDEGQHCCDGQEAILEIADGMENTFAEVHDDDAYVTRVCNAFGLTGCAGKPELSSKKVQIQTANQESATVNTFVPFAQNTRLAGPDYNLPSEAVFDFPRFALKAGKKMQTEVVSFEAGANPYVPGGAQRPDGHNSVILESDPGGKLKKGWFVNLIRLKRDGSPDRWIKYNRFSQQQIQSQNELSLLVGDEPTEAESCMDSDTWLDQYNNNCGNYTAGVWCNEHGEAVQAGIDAWPNGRNDALGSGGLPDGKEFSGLRASWDCCQCGGGEHPAPESLTKTQTILE